jgi:hypothetical protein
MGCWSLLVKVADVGQNYPGDPAGSIRTIQYAALGSGQVAGAGAPIQITTLFFVSVGEWDSYGAEGFEGYVPNPLLTVDYGTSLGAIEPVFLTGDGIFIDRALADSSDYEFLSVPVPEPGATLLIGLGLAGLAAARRSTWRNGLR